MAMTQVRRVTLADMDYLGTGKRARLHRLLYGAGPANGTLMMLPIDQGLSTARATSSSTRRQKTPSFR